MQAAAKNPLNEALKGAVAGAAGVWVMDRVDWSMYLREDAQALRREQAARPNGLDTAHNLAVRLAGLLGQELHPRQPNP